jgi:hypothetical protein
MPENQLPVDLGQDPNLHSKPTLTVVEHREKWTNAVMSLCSSQLTISRLSPAELLHHSLAPDQIIAVEASKEGVKNWMTVFDKNNLADQNQLPILLAAPLDISSRGWYREIGFIDFVSEIADIDRIKRLAKFCASPVVTQNLFDEFALRLPW